MANEITIKFNALDLDDGDELCIESIEIEEKKQAPIHKIPQSQGSIAETAERESLTISVKGSVASTDYDALRTLIDSLKASLHDGIQKFITDDDRYINAQMVSFSYDYKTMRRLAVFDAEFIAHYPFWLAETATEDDRTPTSGAGYTLTNNGNAPARCKIEITAPSISLDDAVKIENQTNGKTFQFSGIVNAYEVLEVDNRYDTDDLQVLNDGADAIVDFEGDFIELDPGNNTIIFTGTDLTAVKITFKDTWY
jgi:phage-related protein